MDENDEDAVQSLNGGSSRFEKQRIFDLHNGNRNCRIFVDRRRLYKRLVQCNYTLEFLFEKLTTMCIEFLFNGNLIILSFQKIIPFVFLPFNCDNSYLIHFVNQVMCFNTSTDLEGIFVLCPNCLFLASNSSNFFEQIIP